MCNAVSKMLQQENAVFAAQHSATARALHALAAQFVCTHEREVLQQIVETLRTVDAGLEHPVNAQFVAALLEVYTDVNDQPLMHY